MKSIYLVRHAKSDWGYEGLADIDRPLNKRGCHDAHMMSNLMKSKKILPDLIITSPAVRAISTALIFCLNFNLLPSTIIIEPNLYDTDIKQYFEIIAKIENSHNNIMLFGHNPIITELANSLTIPFTENIPTCGIVGICQSMKIDHWRGFKDTLAELTLYDYPKNQNDKK